MKTIFINLKDKFFNSSCRKKNIENLVIFLIGVVIVIIAGNYIFADDEVVTISSGSITEVFDSDVFESKLAKILSEIKGAGSVKVMVSYRTGVETGNVDSVMDGKIDLFINGYLKWLSLGCPKGLGGDDES